MPPDTVLRLAGAWKSRGSPPGQFRLHVLDFAVRRGEFVALVGDSGCGKSTMLDMLALISRPDEVDGFAMAAGGREWDLAALWREEREDELAALRSSAIGYVLQTGGLLPFLTVAGNADLVAQLAGQVPDQERPLALAIRLGIKEKLGQKPFQLSGGERQRAAILRALIHRPGVILADEPTAAVDRTTAVRIIDDFHSAARAEGATIVMVTHDLGLIDGRADRRYGFTVEETANGVMSTCSEMTV
jgi:putative ABC transport system ATP-binding protein